MAVTPLALGTSSWGGPRRGEGVTARDARILPLAEKFFAGNLETNLLDTSNEYGESPGGPMAEALVGRALSCAVAPTLVQTKLDRDPVSGEFSGGRAWRSLEESLNRLRRDRVDLLYLHDPENVGYEHVMRPGGAVEALVEMKRQGLASAIGVSGGAIPLMRQMLQLGVFDAIITHNRFTALDRSADALLDEASERGIGVCNAAPYGGGVLTGRAEFAGTYAYRPLEPQRSRALDELRELCSHRRVPMSVAALGVSLRERRIHTTIVGASSLRGWARVTRDARAQRGLEASFWAEVQKITRRLPPLDEP